MCKAIKEMLRVSRQEGEQEGRQEEMCIRDSPEREEKLCSEVFQGLQKGRHLYGSDYWKRCLCRKREKAVYHFASKDPGRCV